jgi:signal transduction histidine kinase
VRQDPGKLRQIISNLLCNAIKFTPGGGQVVLGASIERAEIIVSVADTGIGIAQGDSEKIFERFYQVLEAEQRDGVLVREHQGTGLGLSIARDLSRLLGGDITLDRHPGRGSTFTVRLPQQRSSSAETHRDSAALREAATDGTSTPDGSTRRNTRVSVESGSTAWTRAIMA